MSPELSEKVSSKSFASSVRTMLKGGVKVLKRSKRLGNPYKVNNCHRIVGNHDGVNYATCSKNGEMSVSGSKDGLYESSRVL